LLVLAVHFYPRTLFVDVHPGLATILGRIVTPGRFGVELFFVLSGFLITGILLDTKGDKGFLGKFYARRVLRIFPLYYCARAVLDDGARAILARQGWLWTYMTNWPTAYVWDDSSVFKLGHFWSLAVEEHFYLFWPAMVATLSSRRLVYVAIGLIAIGVVSRTIAIMSPGTFPLFEWTTLSKIDGLAIGAIVAIASRESSLAGLLPTGASFRRWFFVFAVATAGLLLLPRLMQHMVIVEAFGEVIVVVFFGLALLAAVRARPGERAHQVLNSKTLVAFGKYSYGIYVIHGILRPVFERYILPATAPHSAGTGLMWMLLFYAVAICATFGLAWITFHVLEKPFLQLKRHFQ
jgi:peptidoglycan/LPS O-acetylase OafA/YrhL